VLFGSVALLSELPTVFTFVHALLFLAGAGLLYHALGHTACLFTALDMHLPLGLLFLRPLDGFALDGPGSWRSVMALCGGSLLVWGAVGILPFVVRAIGMAVAAVGGSLTAMLRSTAFQIALCGMLFYVGQVAFTGALTRDIYDSHIRPAMRQLDIQIEAKPDLLRQLRDYRDLINHAERF
jgi:hypothetical protein